jgi:phosphatidylcholine synthase
MGDQCQAAFKLSSVFCRRLASRTFEKLRGWAWTPNDSASLACQCQAHGFAEATVMADQLRNAAISAMDDGMMTEGQAVQAAKAKRQEEPMRISEMIDRLEPGPLRTQIERFRGFIQNSIPQDLERKWPGYLVHGFTASGAALGFLALVAAVEGNAALCFVWLGIALIVDGVDGAFARRIDIGTRVPNISGDTLDLVVDFTTYVFVPAALLYYSGKWSPAVSMFAALVIVVTAALYFADKRMKTPDKWFAGFPGVWNIVVFYLILYPPNDWFFVAIVLFFAIGQALPIVFVHPFRVKQWKLMTLFTCGIWLVACASAVWQGMNPDLFTHVILIASGLYLGCLGIFRRPLKDGEVYAD